MSVKITQTCDRCGTPRAINVNEVLRNGFEQSLRIGGWRALENKHACPPCYTEIVESLNVPATEEVS